MISETEDQVSMFDLDSSSGKTLPEPSAPTAEKTSAPSLKKSAASRNRVYQYLDLRTGNGTQRDSSWVTRGASGIGPWTLNTGESPSAAVESHLWQILQAPSSENGCLRRYYLSPKACRGILNRAERRGKRLETKCPILYKALGNSIALPCWRWILLNISAQYAKVPTMASLFDGIGGFPLIWESINGKGTAVWASEIEEFPIAVTKRHFPEEEE